MKTIMPRSRLESFSLSRRYFNWRKKPEDHDDDYNDEEMLTNFNSSSNSFSHETRVPSEEDDHDHRDLDLNIKLQSTRSCEVVPRRSSKNKKLKHHLSVSKFTSLFTRSKSFNDGFTLGSKVVGTLFGYRRGHVHIAFQEDPKSEPAFLIELSTPTSVLVREMASGLVRVALECDKRVEKKGVLKLIEEPLWRAYCNGKKCGYAIKKDCGPEEWRVLRSIGPISMGAGVLPESGGDGDGSGGGDGGSAPPRIGAEGELMYMRAKFERIVGSKESEAFYMMNPDRSGGPELSVYLLRV